MKEYSIKIKISNVNVDEHYYSFDYEVITDYGVKEKDSYESDWENGMTKEEWKKELLDGYAVQLVFEQLV